MAINRPFLAHVVVAAADGDGGGGAATCSSLSMAALVFLRPPALQSFFPFFTLAFLVAGAGAAAGAAAVAGAFLFLPFFLFLPSRERFQERSQGVGGCVGFRKGVVSGLRTQAARERPSSKPQETEKNTPFRPRCYAITHPAFPPLACSETGPISATARGPGSGSGSISAAALAAFLTLTSGNSNLSCVSRISCHTMT